MTAHWSLGFLFGLPAFILLILFFVGLLIVTLKSGWNKDEFDSWVFSQKFVGIVSIVAIVITILGGLFAFYPYSAEYHKYEPVTGTVTAVSSRLIGDGDGGTTQKFAVTLNNGNTYGCDDTRCSLVKPNDVLSLSCIRVWEWSGTPGWNCNYVGDNRVGK